MLKTTTHSTTTKPQYSTVLRNETTLPLEALRAPPIGFQTSHTHEKSLYEKNVFPFKRPPNAQATSLRSRGFMGGGDGLLSDGPRAHLPLINPMPDGLQSVRLVTPGKSSHDIRVFARASCDLIHRYTKMIMISSTRTTRDASTMMRAKCDIIHIR
ncbi:hypothetical protein EVAR_30821_1 [Eumeta japonica]|uniref:Uncharacterized protein n=1 Tax=Eumeta variegata TaxID=151549 RepID=A0A4C1SGQ2_EUMVA|nr:hypothetical protein EVAR_30821_1 [Eumeta japonica]